MPSNDIIASVWRRLAAFLIDTIPITLMVFFIAYYRTDFGDTFDRWWEDPHDPEERKPYLRQRNVIRFVAGVVYFIYCVFFEASRYQATVGKKLARVMVVNDSGGRITLTGAFKRNAMKMFSIIPAFIGCAAALFHPHKQAWHDRFAKTYVVNEPRQDRALGKRSAHTREP